jgi:hypothetical protein
MDKKIFVISLHEREIVAPLVALDLDTMGEMGYWRPTEILEWYAKNYAFDVKKLRWSSLSVLNGEDLVLLAEKAAK